MPTIRLIREADIPNIIRVEQSSGQSSWNQAKINTCLHNTHYHCWLSEQDDICVAYGIMLVTGDECHVMQIVVDKLYQRQQFGKQLLEHMLFAAQQLGAQRSVLEVRVDNQAAIGLYQQLGFRQIGKRKNYYQIDGQAIDADVYQRELSI